MADAAKHAQDEHSPVDGQDKAAGAVDVVEGEVGSARLKEPTEVEAEHGSDDLTKPG